MIERPESPILFRAWGGEGERGSGVTVEVKPGEGEGETELTDEQKAAKELEDKAAKAEEKAKEAEKRAADAEKALQEKEREALDEGEKLKADHEDLQQRYEKLLKFVETTAIDTAIAQLSSKKDKNGQPKYEWNDVKAVRPFLDKDAIKLDLDNFEVDGLESQLADVAKRMPFLLAPRETDGGGSGGGDYSPPDTRSTGSHPYGGTPRPRETDRGKLANKYKFGHLVAGGTPR